MSTLATAPEAASDHALSKRQKDLLGRRLEVERRDTQATVDQLIGDVLSVQQSRHDSPTDDEHDPEGPTLAFEQSQSSALLRQARGRLQQIDDAVARLDAGTYGKCTACHREISYARLGARPYTPHCIACAERFGA